MASEEHVHFLEHHAKRGSWLTPLFECRSAHKYACACLFPCVPMNSVRRLLEDDYHPSDVESSAGALGSAVLVDAPCLAGAMVFNHHVEETLQKMFHGESYAYWARDDSWQAFMSTQMSTLSATLACMVYPCLICPTTCWLRRRAVEKAEIGTETCDQTAKVVTCCWPCALVQMEEELQGEAHGLKKMQRSLASTRMVL